MNLIVLLKVYLRGILILMHKSVLLLEVINYLNVKEDGIYDDATLGYGGHSSLILKSLRSGHQLRIEDRKSVV